MGIDVFINNKNYDRVEEKDLLSCLLMVYSNHIKLSPPYAIRDLLNSLLDLVEEIEPSVKLLNKVKSLRASLEKTSDENIQKFYINTLLSFEGLGNLSGFGMASTESHKGGKKRVRRSFEGLDPEKMSIL